MSQCHYCYATATKLCGFQTAGGGTCDRPLCNFHAHRQSRVHVVFPAGSDIAHRTSAWKTRHYCDQHRLAVEEPTP